MPLTDVEFIHIHRKKQRWHKLTHKPKPYMTICIRKKALQQLRGKHLLLVNEDIGKVALQECKMQVKENAASKDQSHVLHWGITELSEDENEQEIKPKGVLGLLKQKKSVAENKLESVTKA